MTNDSTEPVTPETEAPANLYRPAGGRFPEWARRRVPVHGRMNARPLSGPGATRTRDLFLRRRSGAAHPYQPTLIINNLAASSAHRQPLLPTGSVTTIVTVILRNRAVSGIGWSWKWIISGKSAGDRGFILSSGEIACRDCCIKTLARMSLNSLLLVRATSIEKAEGGGVKGIVCYATPSAVLL
jgi:hypothetical protein